MHVLAPQPRRSDVTIFFNVDAHVGQGAANANRPEVMLVQFLIRKNAQRNTAGIRPDRLQRMLRVKADGNCGPITIDGIRAVQETLHDKNPGTVVDGRISPARGYIYGGGFWTIVSLNAGHRSRYPEVWPRLQGHSDCPGELAAEVVKSL